VTKAGGWLPGLIVCALALAGLAWFSITRQPRARTSARAGYVHDPPYMYADAAGAPRGIAVDVVQQAAGRAGIALEWVRVTAPLDADIALRSSRVDLWPSLTILERRRPDVFFTEPWLQSEVWAVVRDQGALPSSEYAGRVGISALPVTRFLVDERFPKAQRVVYVDRPALLSAICAGEVPVAFLSGGDLADAQSPGSQCAGAALRPHAVAGSTLRLGIGARHGYEGTAERLRAEIDTMAADGTLRNAVVRYSVYAAAEVLGVYEVMQARARTRYLAYGTVMLGGALLITLTLAAAFYRANRRARDLDGAAVAMQAKLHAAQRLELLGQLAGGIAHDFNNLVTIIVGYAVLIESEVSALPRAPQAVQEIRRAGERASDLVRQLLAFSRRQLVEPRVLSLHEQLTDMRAMLCRLVRADIRIDLDLRATHDLVSMDIGQLSRVLMNLTVNAADAMPGGGTLTLATANPPAAAGTVHAVQLTFTDTGVGMSPDVQARVFEPFFTTKPNGRGTGLGLATVHGIITQAGGEVQLRSAPGRGTSFEIRLPTVEGPRVVERPTATKAASVTRGVILVVEDQDEVRSLVAEVLRQAGYGVIEAANGRIALERLEGDDGAIALVLSDLVMPEMSGQQLFERACQLDREHRFLFMSGYSEEGVPCRGTSEPVLLTKPFTPAQLLRAVGIAIGATS
jgi:two-component system cell cycle sensor histidine kinase/response regulator CckA